MSINPGQHQTGSNEKGSAKWVAVPLLLHLLGEAGNVSVARRFVNVGVEADVSVQGFVRTMIASHTSL